MPLFRRHAVQSMTTGVIDPIEHLVLCSIKSDRYRPMDLGQVTLTQMRYAVAIAGTGGFRLAARQCAVSQSGLSMQIHKLEELLGIVLFDRSRKPVLLTEEGQTALAQMKTVLRETERLGQMVAEEHTPSGRFRLGVIPTLSPTVLPLFLKPFILQCPQVELVIEELTTPNVIARLQADTLDAGLAVTPLEVPGLQEEAVGKETMFAYLPPGDVLLKRKALQQRDLKERQLWVMPEGHCFRSQVLSYCGAQQAERSQPIHFESGNFQTLIRLVDEGMGATILPALVVDGLPARTRSARVRPLNSPTPVREIGIVTARADLRRRVSSVLTEVVRTALATALAPAPRRAVIIPPLPAR